MTPLWPLCYCSVRAMEKKDKSYALPQLQLLRVYILGIDGVNFISNR